MEQVEQITKEPSAAPQREKDPKRVAAGKKLAEKNKQMREEHAKYKAMEEESNERMREENAQYKASEEESNERMREENAQYKASEEERLKADETSDSSLSDGFLSQLTLGNVLSLLGVGLSIYALFFKGETKAKVTWSRPVETMLSSPEEKQQPKPKIKTKAVETKQRPKIGM